MPVYTALGDSISSGEGLFNYDALTDTTINQCHRASDNLNQGAYPQQIEMHLREEDLLPSDFHFWTCSGAVIDNILRHGQGGEPPQIDSVDPDSTLVTITLGGNDMDVWGIGDACVGRPGVPIPSCHTTEDEGARGRIEDMMSNTDSRGLI